MLGFLDDSQAVVDTSKSQEWRKAQIYDASPEDNVPSDNTEDIDSLTLPDGKPMCPKLAVILKKYRHFNSSMDQENLHRELDNWFKETMGKAPMSEDESQAVSVSSEDLQEELSDEHAYDYNHDMVPGYDDHDYGQEVAC